MASSPTPARQPEELAALALCATAATLKRLQALRIELGVRLQARLGDLDEAEDHVRSFDPDALILDFTSPEAPDTGRLETVALLAKSIPIVGLIRPGAVELREKLLEAGVLGVLPSDAAGRELTAALRAVQAQLVVIHPALLNQDAGPLGARPAPDENGDPESGERLTPRETEVLQLMAEGYANKEIAELLAISGHTVKFHVSAVLGKLGVESRAEAAMEGIRTGRVVI
ncbi:MAG TPA: response regulator transcription factor [Terriglobia bacterium]|nr:response regulator transcription factor [Terriglobia bacterium]